MLTVVVQAGGESTRMGEDKALKVFLGHALIERVIERLRSLTDDVVVTTNRPEPYRFLGLPLVADLRPGRGALGGLYTALEAAQAPLVAVVACDLPFVSAALLAHAADVLTKEGVDVVIPESAEGLEPLHAVYRRATCLPAIEAALDAGQWKVIAWFPQVKVRVLSRAECAPWDQGGLAFWNVNTPAEFAEAEARALAAR